MNCCNCNCNQGRNCPAKVAKVGRRMLAADPLPPSNWRENMRLVCLYMLVALELMAIATFVFLLSRV